MQTVKIFVITFLCIQSLCIMGISHGYGASYGNRELKMQAAIDPINAFSVKTSDRPDGVGRLEHNFGVLEEVKDPQTGEVYYWGCPTKKVSYLGFTTNSTKSWRIYHSIYQQMRNEKGTLFKTYDAMEALRCVPTPAYDSNGNMISKYPDGLAFRDCRGVASNQLLYHNPGKGSDSIQVEYYLTHINPGQESGTYTGMLIYSIVAD